MLKAGLFDEFKGATTLLVWGDGEGMGALFHEFSALHSGNRDEFSVEGPHARLTVCAAPDKPAGSTLATDGTDFRWSCSRDALELACALIQPLLSQAGHQFVSVDGLAEQIIIARDEYPADLR